MVKILVFTAALIFIASVHAQAKCLSKDNVPCAEISEGPHPDCVLIEGDPTAEYPGCCTVYDCAANEQ